METLRFNQDSQKNDLNLQACNWNKLETKEERSVRPRGVATVLLCTVCSGKKNHVSLKQSSLHRKLQAICINVSTMIFFLFMGPKFLIKY